MLETSVGGGDGSVESCCLKQIKVVVQGAEPPCHSKRVEEVQNLKTSRVVAISKDNLVVDKPSVSRFERGRGKRACRRGKRGLCLRLMFRGRDGRVVGE